MTGVLRTAASLSQVTKSFGSPNSSLVGGGGGGGREGGDSNMKRMGCS